MTLDISVLHQRRERAKQHFQASSAAHQEVSDRLLDRLEYVLIKPTTVLVFGWQTAYTSSCLKKRYPDATIETADNWDQLSVLSACSVDLIISNLALEWEPEPKVTLAAFERVLTDEGLLHFTTVGPDTGLELRKSFEAVDAYPHVHVQTDMHHIADCMKGLSFSDPVVDMEILTLAYDDLSDLFQDLKNTASTNIDAERAKGCLTKRQWMQMLSEYQSFKIDDYYPFTLEVIYGHAWKVDKTEVLISAEKISVKNNKS